MSSPNTSPLQVSPSPPVELRHITSSGALTPQKDANKLSTRTSQHLSHRLGSPSPVSIPSSPTSIHSSSSAIFERDIEPISPSPPQASHANPHRTPRGKLTEQLDQAVPSVLDSAAEVLTSTSSPIDDQNIAIVAPILDLGTRSGLASPSSRMSSRSPSPSAVFGHGSGGMRSGTLNSLPSPSPSLTLPLPLNTSMTSGSPSPPSQPPQVRPNLQTLPSTPHPPGALNPTVSSTPTSAYFTTASSGESSPTTMAREHAPSQHLPVASAHAGDTSTSQVPGSPTQTATSTVSHPPSPRVQNNRLSFISYNDLLTSTPTSTVPLSSFTTSSEPPPHLPTVLGVPQQMAGSAAGSIHSNPRSSFYGERDVREGREGLFLDDQGGEWEREGLGQGLEERLDKLMGVGAVGLGKA